MREDPIFKYYSKTCYEQPPLWAATPMGGHLANPQKDILYTNEPPMGSHWS